MPDSRENAIGDYIRSMDALAGDRVPYPIEKERELCRAIRRRDREMADGLLNQILGHIYFYAADEEEILVRVMELLVVMIRAAIDAGAELTAALDLSRRFLREASGLREQEDLTRWLAGALRTLTDRIFPVADTARHAGAIRRAADYIKRNFAARLSLEAVAEQAGYSPSYFSRIFREETGSTFQAYLNALRVERAKALLLTEDLSLSEVASLTGFGDQSYFTRVFQRTAGVTPDRYRKAGRREGD